MKILVFCCDVLPGPGMPTSGGGLRCWQLIESLRNLGHDVIASTPLFTYLGRRFWRAIDAVTRANSWTVENQDELVERHRPDAILFSSSWIADRLHRDHDCVFIYDLHGPQLLEQQYKLELDTIANAQVKIEKLAKADFVLCAGTRQSYYFLPFLLMAGFDVASLERFAVVSIACPDTLPEHADTQGIEIVAGGGFFPWQDPSIGFRALGGLLRAGSYERARFRIFGRSHGITGGDDERFQALVRELEGTPGVSFHDFVSRDSLLEAYRSASFAFDLHAHNRERELAFTTRTVEYLWSGLPVLTNNYGELPELIADYGAGWTVDPHNAGAITDTLKDIFENPEQIAHKRCRAQCLVREQLTFSRVIGPLERFLERPSRRNKPRGGKLIAMREFERLTRCDGEYRELLKSRALKVATTVSAWRRSLAGTAR